MLRILFFLLPGFACIAADTLAQGAGNYSRTPDAVIVYPSEALPGNAKLVKLQVIKDNIVRVIAAPQKALSDRQSLITVYVPDTVPAWTLKEEANHTLLLATALLHVRVNTQTGAVAYFDIHDNPIMREQAAGRSLKETVYEGRRSYSITQLFETADDDAYYGLGQHQQGLLNYKGHQVMLFQNNTEVAVPFLLSRKNYGLLWDNYSITQVGDIRPYHSLCDLKLFAKDGEPGWLTASYSNDRNKPNDVMLQKAESSISYQYVNESKLFLPVEFKPATGVITWEGALASDIAGEHVFHFTYAGYIKVWLNGKLVLDRWRQAWNPCLAAVTVPLEKGKQCSIRIEWIPDGTESYIGVQWQEPVRDINSLGFASEAGQQLDYYFVYGNSLDEVIGGYRTLTGKASIIPQWAFGFWQSRERYKTQQELLDVVAAFRKKKIPLDNIVQDWSYWKEDDWGSQEFDASRFPNPDSVISVLHEKYHTRFMISVWPKFYEGIDAYNSFNKKGWLYTRNIADRQRDWIGKGYVSTFYDPFNKDARLGFWKLLSEKLYSKGVNAWWMDASEPDILSNVSPQKRKEQLFPLAGGTAAEYLNAYPLENAKGIYEGQRSEKPGERVFILTRSAFAGLQRYSSAVWSGDIASRWHDMELQIPAGINFSMSGIPYWTMDIGGFAVEKRFEHPNKQDEEEWQELTTRWFQFGAFVPLFRSHGQFPYREIFNVAQEGQPAYQSMLYYNKLRYRLLPYIYSLAGHAYINDYTLMRGLVMDFPGDNVAVNVSDQYMFGPSLLVSPVYRYKERSRQVYLPAGQGWYDLYSGKYTGGGQTIEADAPYERMPVFVKAGSVIPFGPGLQYTSERKADTITLYVYGGKDAAFSLYEDEGTNYNYEKGFYAVIPITYDDKNRLLTIGPREGSFPGMLTRRYFRVKYINPQQALALDPGKKEGVLVTYNGNRKTVKL